MSKLAGEEGEDVEGDGGKGIKGIKKIMRGGGDPLADVRFSIGV